MRNAERINELKDAAKEIRRNLLKLCNKEVIHIGGDLSITDVMCVLWQYQMKYDPGDPKAPDRDRFVLSKGHASAVTSFCQAAIGCFDPQDVIDEYAKDDGRFSMHSCNLVNPYVDVSTGSLGHGFPIAVGIAQGLKMRGNTQNRVYVVMGDGEQEEGSIWESALTAVHHKLGNLVAVVDYNKIQADGTLENVSGLTDIASRYESIGWNVIEADGNSIEEVKSFFDGLPDPASDVPTVLIAHTVKGKGVSFMENKDRWHAGKINDDQLAQALEEIDRS